MAGTFNLQVVTPEREVFNAAVESVSLPGSEGSFGVLRNHAPLIAALEPGTVVIVDADNNEILMAVGGGFFQVVNNVAIILADSAERAGDIDLARAEESEKRARSRLAGQLETENTQRERAASALKRARARLRVASGR